MLHGLRSCGSFCAWVFYRSYPFAASTKTNAICLLNPTKIHWQNALSVMASFIAMTKAFQPANAEAHRRNGTIDERDWYLKEAVLPGKTVPLHWWQRRSVVADGAGVHLGTVIEQAAEYLWRAGAKQKTGIMSGENPKPWQNKNVLEIGCGCGYITVALACWGAKVFASDLNVESLALTQANVKRNASHNSQVQLCRFDCTDKQSCQQLCERFGPFHAIIVVDGVLSSPTLGGTWQGIGNDHNVAVAPKQILEACRELGGTNAEVILVVVDRAGDVKAVAQALLEERRWLELASPHDLKLPTEVKTKAVVFHWRWRSEAGLAGNVASQLWPYL